MRFAAEWRRAFLMFSASARALCMLQVLHGILGLQARHGCPLHTDDQRNGALMSGRGLASGVAQWQGMLPATRQHPL